MHAQHITQKNTRNPLSLISHIPQHPAASLFRAGLRFSFLLLLPLPLPLSPLFWRLTFMLPLLLFLLLLLGVGGSIMVRRRWGCFLRSGGCSRSGNLWFRNRGVLFCGYGRRRLFGFGTAVRRCGVVHVTLGPLSGGGFVGTTVFLDGGCQRC